MEKEQITKILDEIMKEKVKEVDNYFRLMDEAGVLSRVDAREQLIMKALPNLFN